MSITAYPRTSIVSGGANTKGAYAELTAATTIDSSFTWLFLNGSAVQDRFLVDFAIGALGAETIIVSNIICYSGFGGFINYNIPIEFDIPIGTRLSARCQSSTTGADDIQLYVIQEDRALASLTNLASYGAITATTRGVAVNAGAVALVKGVYSEITAATTFDHDVLVIVFTGAGNTGPAIAAFFIDIAIGAAGLETVIIPDLGVRSESGGDNFAPNIFKFPYFIPSGTRIAARSASTTTDATDRILDIQIIGMQTPASGGTSIVASSHAYVG